MTSKATRRDRFEQLYSTNPDPWNFETSDYERDKRVVTLKALRHRRYSLALEIGSATGVLTQDLLTVCDQIVGIELAEAALTRAQARLSGFSQAKFQQGEVPRDWPPGSFDLIVFSEILYFLDEREILEVSSLARKALTQDGICLLVNWTGHSDLALDGDQVVGLFAKEAEWCHKCIVTCPTYRIDTMELA